MATFDAVLVGSGINTLTAAAMLARDGWSVCILERSDRLGGASATGPRYTAHRTASAAEVTRERVERPR